MIDLKEIDSVLLLKLNRRLFDEPEYPYENASMGGFDAEEATRKKISQVKKDKRDRLLAAAPQCPIGDEQGFRDWWAAWMSIAAGRQIWPDGNHRTAMMLAENIAELAGFTMVLDEDDIEDMRSNSKALITQLWQSKPKNTHVTEAELLDPNCPVRAFYEGFRHRLQLEPLD